MRRWSSALSSMHCLWMQCALRHLQTAPHALHVDACEPVPRRGAWNWVHHSMGYTLLLVALANAFIGLYLGDAGCGALSTLLLRWWGCAVRPSTQCHFCLRTGAHAAVACSACRYFRIPLQVCMTAMRADLGELCVCLRSWGWYLAVALVWCVIAAVGAALSVRNRRKGLYPAGTLTGGTKQYNSAGNAQY